MEVTQNTERRSGPASEVVAEALAVKPGATVAELSETVGLSQSSVSKALAVLESAGIASREHGGRDGRRRLADRWSPTTTGTPSASDDHGDAPGNDDEGNDDEGNDDEGNDDEANDDEAHVESRVARTDRNRDRLGKGALGSLVLAHLAANPSEDHGPVTVAKALGDRSSGAVGNALQRLCDSGDAVLVSKSPRRYRFAEPAGAGPAGAGPAGAGKATNRGRPKAQKAANR